MKFSGLSVLAVVLTSCGPTGPSFEERSCSKYGYKPGTNSYRDCVAAESRANRQARSASRSSSPAPGSYEWQLGRLKESLYD